MEPTKENIEKALEIIEIAKKTGKVKKGVNETTKAIERDVAKLVAYAGDINPQEIVMHLEPLCAEKKIPCIKVNTREELGVAAGLGVPTTSVAVIDVGDAKSMLNEFKE